MNLNFTTKKLPTQLISLAYLLLAIGIWRIFVLDYLGILLVVLSIFVLSTKSGIAIDAENKKLKKYTVFLFFKKGIWEDIKTVESLIIKKVKISQNIHLLSLSKTDTRYKYSIILTLADRNFEIITTENNNIIKDIADKNIEIITTENYNKIKKIADKLAAELNVPIIDKTAN